MADITPAHDQTKTLHYRIHVPDHPPRTSDPHYVDFNHYHHATRPTARCYVGERLGYDSCRDAQGNLCSVDVSGQMSGLELHHAHVEFCLQNGISLAALEHDYPGISDPDQVGTWVESAQNFRWLCAYHHRSTAAGAHAVSHSDWEGGVYVQDLFQSS